MNTNPLKLLRSGPLPTVRPRQRTATLPNSHTKNQTKPSFNTLDNKKSGSAASLDLPREFPADLDRFKDNARLTEENPIPLPPRDRNKPLLASKPRHTRKHPLIIPSSSIKTTLNKFSAVTPPICNSMESFDHTDSTYSNDTESIHFEQRIDSELAALDDLSGEADAVDAPIDTPTEGAQLQRDYVSCEDLLEFADAKPSSRARGFESDEVRLMCKVLGQDVSADNCLRALEFTNWDVGSAIKICKVQKVVIGAEFIACNDALVANGWDEKKAAQWILHQDNEVQV